VRGACDTLSTVGLSRMIFLRRYAQSESMERGCERLTAAVSFRLREGDAKPHDGVLKREPTRMAEIP
jgi:hypothetical protein